jgi:RNA 2',3'-cyclic 3'-phosphodiesterase
MRLFVAVDLDDGVRREVGNLIRHMRSEARDDRSLRISWVAPDQLHLTLHFLANVDVEMGARIAESVAAPIDLPAFRIAFGDAGTFPSRGRPNVIWLGVSQGRAPLIDLQAVVGRRLKAVGCELEERPFSPHLTLARLRQLRGTGRRRFDKGSLSASMRFDKGGLAPMLVDRVTLYESQLGGEGATHIALATGRLRPERISS